MGLGGFEWECDEADAGGVIGYISAGALILFRRRIDRGGLGGASATKGFCGGGEGGISVCRATSALLPSTSGGRLAGYIDGLDCAIDALE